LRLENPGLAAISCDDCHKYVYDLKTGKLQTYQCGSPDNVKPVPRVTPPPCRLGAKCPRESPEKSHLYRLHPRSRQAMAAYEEHRAGNTPARDALQRRVFAILDWLYREYDRRQLAEELAILLIPRI
jgi:hypothetical protein